MQGAIRPSSRSGTPQARNIKARAAIRNMNRRHEPVCSAANSMLTSDDPNVDRQTVNPRNSIRVHNPAVVGQLASEIVMGDLEGLSATQKSDQRVNKCAAKKTDGYIQVHHPEKLASIFGFRDQVSKSAMRSSHDTADEASFVRDDCQSEILMRKDTCSTAVSVARGRRESRHRRQFKTAQMKDQSYRSKENIGSSQIRGTQITDTTHLAGTSPHETESALGSECLELNPSNRSEELARARHSKQSQFQSQSIPPCHCLSESRDGCQSSKNEIAKGFLQDDSTSSDEEEGPSQDIISIEHGTSVYAEPCTEAAVVVGNADVLTSTRPATAGCSRIFGPNESPPPVPVCYSQQDLWFEDDDDAF